TLEGVLPPAVGRDAVSGEDVGHLVPELLVEAAQVAVLELLDRLDLHKILRCEVFGRYRRCCHGIPPVEMWTLQRTSCRDSGRDTEIRGVASCPAESAI